MGVSVTALRNKLTGGGARPSLFFAKIEFPGKLKSRIMDLSDDSESDISFFMRTATIPQSTLEAQQVPFLGRQLKVPSIDRTFQPFTTQIINDEDYKVRHFFESWIEILSPGRAIFEATSGFATNPNENAVYGQLQVHQMTKDGKVSGTDESAGGTGKYRGSYYFIDAFPIRVGDIALSWDQGGEIENFDVEFEYQYWIKQPGEADAIGSNPFKDDKAVNWVDQKSVSV